MFGLRTPPLALQTLAATFIAFAATDSAGDVCAGDAVPAGQVVRWDGYDTFGCQHVNRVEWTTGSPVASGQTVCDVRGFADFTLPDDFIITSRSAPTLCIRWPPSPAAKPQNMSIRSPTTGVFDACPGSNLPDPYVVTLEGNTFPCEDNGGLGAGFSVRPAVPGGMWTCSNWPLPSGYVITRYGTTGNCNLFSGGVQRYILQPSLSGNTDICEASPIPDGFAVIAESANVPNCDPDGSGSGPGFTIGPAVDGSYTCSTTGIPPTLVIESITVSGTCLSGIQYNLRLPPTGGSETRACNPSGPPTGFVIVEETPVDAFCNDGPSSSIRTPLVNPPSDLTDVVCRTSPIPDGFVTTSTLPNGSCLSVGGVFHIRLMQPGDSVTACPDSPIPDGFVFTEGVFAPCGINGAMVDGLTIGPAEDGARACSSNLPAGFVIGDIANDGRCAGGISYGVVLPPQDGSTTLACNPSVTPSGFVITSRDLNNPTCLGGVQFGIRVPSVGETLTVCLDSPIPSGFVITGHPASTSCEGDPTETSIGPPEPAGTDVCEDSPIPLGYVVTLIDNNFPGCGLNGGIGNGRHIRLPNDPGTTEICLIPEAPIPTGFVQVGSNGPQPECGNAEQIVIQPELSEPLPFIDPEPDVTGPPAPVTIQCPPDGTGALVDSASRNTAVCP